MAAELWNKVNIPFPSAVSTVRIPFTGTTANNVSCLLKCCGSVLRLLRSEVLQTEIRVLYALLHVLNNSLRQHKPFRTIKQVEQCINRLSDMRLDAALQDLTEICPKKAQRLLEKQTGLIEVPSQPMLEWLCLKMLGACKLMLCLSQHCSAAFLLTGQHLWWKEFIIMNVVTSSMLSRLWVFSRGFLRGLCPLYQEAQALLQKVSLVQPMPFLTNFQLPPDIPAFLGSAYQSLLEAEPLEAPAVKKGNRPPAAEGQGSGGGQKLAQSGVKISKRRPEDLGSIVSNKRSAVIGRLSVLDMKAMLKKAHGNAAQVTTEMFCQPETLEKGHVSQEVAVNGQKQRLLDQVQAASSFEDLVTHLAAMIRWCKSRKLRRESSRLAFQNLRCRRMRDLEADGFRVDRKLKSFRRAVCDALLLRQGSGARQRLSLSIRWRNRLFRTHSGMRSRWRWVHSGPGRRKKRSTIDRITGRDEPPGREGEAGSEPVSDSENEIEDIFSSFGF